MLTTPYAPLSFNYPFDGMSAEGDPDDILSANFLEISDGDLSDDANAPTVIDLDLGGNRIRQQVNGDDVDYFTVTIEPGQVLRAIIVETVGGSAGSEVFIGVQAGTSFTEPRSNPNLDNLLAGVTVDRSFWGQDIMDDLASGDVGAGFDGTLGPGDYTFWIENAAGNQAGGTLFFVVDTTDNQVPTDGSDEIYGTPEGDTIDGGTGADRLIGHEGDDTLIGGLANDVLSGGLGNDILRGGDGNDILEYSVNGNDQLFGEGGNDVLEAINLYSQPGEPVYSVLLDGGEGDDVFSLRYRGELDLTIIGGEGNDRVEATIGDGRAVNTIDLGSGDDSIYTHFGTSPTPGTYNITLGEGVDRYRFGALDTQVSFTSETSSQSILNFKDFQTGDAGDIFEFDVRRDLPGWDRGENPFALQLARLTQVGDDTILELRVLDNIVGQDNYAIWRHVATFENTLATDFTDANFNGIDISLALTPLELNILGNDTRNVYEGSAGNDTINGASGRDRLDGGAGDDLIFGDNAAALDRDSIEGQIFRAYQAVFDRAPDLAGFRAFEAELRLDNLSLSDVITEFVSSAEFQNTYGELDNGAFVEQLYRNVLDREADEEGLTAFTNELNAGRSRADVVLEFTDSAEFIQLTALSSAAFANSVIRHPAEGQVYRIYQAVFDRNPDFNGFEAFTNSIQAGVQTLEDVTAEFVASAEFQSTYGTLDNAAFVDLLFTNVLPGNTDPFGRAAYTAALDDETLTRAEIVAELSESLEFRNATDASAESWINFALSDETDQITGGTGNDTLFGGRGPDIFNYDVSQDGEDVILDFDLGYDFIALSGDAAFDSFAEVMAAATQVGQDVLFDFGNGQTLTLNNVTLSSLTEEDFIFDDAPVSQTSADLPLTEFFEDNLIIETDWEVDALI